MVTFYVKPTNQCNLECDHCFVPPQYKRRREVISCEVVEGLCDFILWLGVEEVSIIYHGGEPLLFGVSFLRDISNLMLERLHSKVKVNFHVQSNLVSSGWEVGDLVDFCKKYTKGVVGTSYDFEIRRYRGSHDYFYSRWSETVQDLLRNGIFVNINITMTRLLNVDVLFDFIKYWLSLGVNSFHLERFAPSGTGALFSDKLYLSNSEYYSLLKEILFRYVDILKQGIKFYMNPFDKMTRMYYMGTGAGCFSGDCMYKMFTVNPDGSISNCPDFAFYDDYIFGNVLSKDFSSIYTNPKRLRAIHNQVSFICPSCRFFSICKGGCPLHYQVFDGKSCVDFFSAFEEKVGDIYSCIVDGS